MAREVCIKQGTTTVCTGSALHDCSCNRKGFVDPFLGVQETGDVLQYLSEVIRIGEAKLSPDERDARTYALMACARLLYVPNINVTSPFVIMAMDPAPAGSSPGSTAE